MRMTLTPLRPGAHDEEDGEKNDEKTGVGRGPARFAAIAAAFSKDGKVTREKGWGSGNVVLKLREKTFAC